MATTGHAAGGVAAVSSFAERTVKKAVFRVDGAKVKTVKKPTKKQVTTLTGLNPDEMAAVSVTLKLVKKGAGKPAVERTYLACT